MKYLFVSLAHLLVFDVSASNDIFIEVKNKNFDLNIGYYSNTNLKQVVLKEIPIDSISKTNFNEILKIDHSKKILIYFHAMWGNGRKSQRSNLKLFRRLCKGEEGESPYQIVNVVWKAGSLNYKKNWYNAFEIGRILCPVFENITQVKGKYNILCHSMGHRVFEGVIASSRQNFELGNILFFAADLDADVFSEKLKPLLNYAQEINVYIHNNDRLLKYSKRRHKRQRLGLIGISNTKTIISDKINIINVSTTNAKGSKNISRHLYFKKDEKVMADLQNVLAGDFEKRQLISIDKSKNHFKL